MLKPHPHNPYGVLVPCANCGEELHIPRAEAEDEDFDAERITCSYTCMKARRADE